MRLEERVPGVPPNVAAAVHKALSPDQGLPPDDEASVQKAESAAERALSHSAKKFQGASIAPGIRPSGRSMKPID